MSSDIAKRVVEETLNNKKNIMTHECEEFLFK